MLAKESAVRIIPLLLAAALSGCSLADPDRSHPLVVPAPAEFRNAPASFVWDGRVVGLSASLYRDFMPVAPRDGRPLTVLAAAADPSPSPVAAFPVLTLLVIRGDRAWVADIEQAPSIPGVFAVEADGGPKWGPGEAVDVVARLRLPDGRSQLVAARGVPIQRLD